MSTTIDQRVVEMKFDNRQFESNVSTTMSTLDKLKSALNFKGAAQGLEKVDAAARNVNVSNLGNAVETVHARFSALEVMGVTALANITNSAVNAGKKMLSALTIDPIKTGFQEYETQINSVQTILANTASKGSTIEDVNKALEELNTYADKTIYNFTEMTRNIGTFTAAGIDLKTSTQAIQGIANLAAVSGSTSQQASTAMYQLSQALAAGTVKLMDWNSVVNAGMGGEVFQNALIRTAALMEGVSEETFRAEKIGESFRESLSSGWITAEVLTKTLNTFTTSGVNEYLAEQSGLTADAVAEMREQALASGDVSKAYREMAKTLAKNSKLTEDQIYEYLNMSTTAEDAATKVKTFTQLWDVMKESAQSGWSQTWKLIVGDFEEAKSLLTPLSDFFTGVIGKISDARNKLLESALNKGFKNLAESIFSITEPVSKAIESLKSLEDMVDQVILGKFDNGKKRIELLTEAGYNYYAIQNKVNETLGYTYRYTEEQIAAQDKLLGTHKEVQKVDEQRLVNFTRMSRAQLESIGLTEEQIAAIDEFKTAAEKMGIPVESLVAHLDELNGRWLLMNSFKNIGQAIVKVVTAIADAWREVFPPMTSEQLFNIIAGFHKLTTYLKVDKEEAEKITRTFQGLFAIIDIIATVTGGALKVAFEVVTAILKHFNLDILDVTAGIGDVIVGFRDWIDSIFNVSGATEALLTVGEEAISVLKKWYEGLKESEAFASFKEKVIEAKDTVVEWFTSLDGKAIFDTFVDKLSKAKDAIVNWFASLKDMTPREIAESIVNGIAGVIDQIGGMFRDLKDIVLGAVDGIPDGIISGFVEGLKDGAVKVGQVIVEIGKILVERIKEYLGIHSPSTVFFAIGGFIIAGLVGGLVAGSGDVWQTIKDIGAKCVDYISQIDFGAIFAAAIAAGMVGIGWKVASALQSFASPFEALGGVLENAADTVKIFNKGLKKMAGAMSFSVKMNAIKSLAVAIGILVAAVVALTFFDFTELMGSVTIIASLALVLGMLAKAIDMMNLDPKNLSKFTIFALTLSASLLILVAVTKILSGMEWDEFGRAAAGLGLLTACIVALIGATWAAGPQIDKAGMTILLFSVAMLALTKVMKNLSKMDWDDLKPAIAGFAVLGVVIAALIAATRLAGNEIDKAGGMFAKISAAMLILVITAKIIAGMEWDELGKAAVGLVGLGGIVTGLISATKLAGKDIDKVGTTVLAISGAIAILAVVAKLLATMEWEELGKAAVGLVALGGIVTGLIAATKLAGKDLEKVGVTMILISAAIAILAGVAAILGLVDLTTLAKGIGAVAILSAIMAGLIAVTKFAQDCKANLIVITVAIGVMAAAVGILSCIDSTKLAGATAAMSILMAVFAGMIAATKLATGSMANLIVLTAAVAAFAGVIVMLSQIDTEKAIEASVALSLLVTSLSVALVALGAASKLSNNALGGIIALTAMVVPLLAFIGVLAIAQNIENATANAIVLSAFTAALTVVLAGLTVIGNFAVQALSGVLALTALAVPLLAFIGELALMQNIENAEANAKVLSTFIVTLTAVLAALTVIGGFATLAVAGVAALTLMAVPLIAFIGELALLNCIPNAQANADLLAGFMTTMADVLVKVGIVAPLAVVGVGAIAALSAVMIAIGALATGIGALMTQVPELEGFLNKGLPILEQLATAIGTFLGNMVGGFIESVGKSISETLPKLGTGLSEFMTNAQPFITGVKMVNDKVLAGVAVLSAAILALTAVDLLAGISSFIQGGSSFAQLGMDLSMFMLNAMPFINGAAMLSPSVMDGVKALAETILILTAADVVNGLTSWFKGDSSLASFGSQLPQLGSDLNAFATNLGTFDETRVATITSATNAIKTIAEAAQNLPNEGGWLGKIMGENGLGAFGAQLPQLGKDISAFADNLGAFDETKVTTINSAANAVKAIADVATTLPNEGGWAAKMLGDNSLAAFGEKLPTLATNLTEFAFKLGKFDETKVATITSAANAIKAIADVASELPNEGGWAAAILGDNSIASFGEKLPQLGIDLGSFVTKLGTFDEASVNTVNCAVDAIVALSQAASSIDAQAGWAKALFGDNSISAFGTEIASLGTSLNQFVSNIGTFTPEQVLTVKNSVAAVKAFTELANADLSGAKKNMSGFGDKVVAFAKDLATFCNEVPSNESVDNAVSNMNDIIEAIQAIKASDATVVSDFTKAMKKIGKEGVSEFIKAFTSDTAKTNVKNAAKTLINNAIKGIKDKKEALIEALTKIVDNAIEALGDLSEDFYDAGAALVSGFTKGISENTFKAEAEAAAMARAALEAAEEELDINSPSKEFEKVGDYAGQGFVKALRDYASESGKAGAGIVSSTTRGIRDALYIASPSKELYKVGMFAGQGFTKALGDFVDISYQAGHNLASASKDGLRDTFNKMSDIFSSDVDVTPTIRPVLDLSEVKSGASKIGSMLDVNPSVGVSANLNAINSRMNGSVQNGGNGDIVNAINKLRDKFDNIGNTTYSINGVTYDDGSNISDAVKSIVRAARIERRV